MYFITVIEKIEKQIGKILSIGDTRCWGYYSDKKVAFDVVTNNRTDLFEDRYKYVFIEKIGEGICADTEKRWLFEFDHDNGKYIQIDEPDCIKNCENFSIG